jgi:tripartite-type tricarboxylate transporter receptor subunit TctC
MKTLLRIVLMTPLATPAFAQGAYPQKQVRVIAPFPAGGNIGAEIAVRAEPQGGTGSATVAFIKEEEARWRGVIKSANVSLSD